MTHQPLTPEALRNAVCEAVRDTLRAELAPIKSKLTTTESELTAILDALEAKAEAHPSAATG